MNNHFYISPILWKNITFLIGLLSLFIGAMFLNYPDWDINISLLMALSTYLSADKFILAIKQKNYLMIPKYSIYAWWSIDGIYWLYWSLVNSSVMIREGQWLASLCLYLLCGLVWTAFPAGISPTVLRQHLTNLGQPDPKKDLTGTYQ